MAVAGTSSPASGGEHLISHFLDMTAPYEPAGPRRPALHGEQVGVGTAVTTRAWLAIARDPGRPPGPGAAPGIDDARRRIETLATLPRGLRDRFVDESRAKLARIAPAADRRALVQARLAGIVEVVGRDLELARRIAEVLPSIGGPCTPSSIGVSPASVRTAWREARWIRDRYTVLDLVDDLGWTDRLEEEALRFDAGASSGEASPERSSDDPGRSK